MTAFDPAVGAAQTRAAPDTSDTKKADLVEDARAGGLDRFRVVGGSVGDGAGWVGRWRVTVGPVLSMDVAACIGGRRKRTLDEAAEQAAADRLHLGQPGPVQRSPRRADAASTASARVRSTSTWNCRP